MANLEPKLLYIGDAEDSPIYNVSGNVGSYAIVRSINACNTTNTDKVFSLHLVAGGNPSSNNKIMSNIRVPANDVVVSEATYVLNEDHSLYLTQDDSSITVAVSGAEYIT